VVSKWKIKSGDVLWLKGFYGSGTSQVPGVNLFHVAMVESSPINGTINITVDTKFRDLLTVEEAIARGRDTLAPVRALQINKQSALINDLAMPWNAREGSGVWPRYNNWLLPISLHTGTAIGWSRRGRNTCVP
jgi:copper chaperone CopZ